MKNKELKFKLPKKIRILNVTFKVDYNKSEGGGFFDFGENTIGIGTKHLDRDPEAVFEIFVHEIGEAIHCLLNTRYQAGGNERDYVFVQDHKQFQNHITILSGIIHEQLLK